MIALVMQHLDNSITTFTKRGKLGIRWYSSKQGTANRTRPGSRSATR
ncbi:cholesterol oxidase domain protein [Mycobacterium ulcerans str. Harvey]|uniref:Cholesterol oxidase domain protein n=1 Tax=Mycobacterium ulcerans str. Harvey TaxID=1299332 RepID=A0ABP3ALK4_MYCUL|nr:cholesterol oxidase domain protein [Mycobacterium ulcerans str. Harvey]